MLVIQTTLKRSDALQKNISDMEDKELSPVEWLFYKLWDEPKDKFTWYSLLKKAKEKEEELKDFDTWKEWKNRRQ